VNAELIVQLAACGKPPADLDEDRGSSGKEGLHVSHFDVKWDYRLQASSRNPRAACSVRAAHEEEVVR